MFVLSKLIFSHQHSRNLCCNFLYRIGLRFEPTTLQSRALYPQLGFQDKFYLLELVGDESNILRPLDDGGLRSIVVGPLAVQQVVVLITHVVVVVGVAVVAVVVKKSELEESNLSPRRMKRIYRLLGLTLALNKLDA